MNKRNRVFSVTLVNEDKGLNKTIQVSQDEYILDAAEEQGIALPYSCRAGACTTCVAKVIKGTVYQTDQALRFLSYDQVEVGYILTCAASPTSNCTIATHQEDQIF